MRESLVKTGKFNVRTQGAEPRSAFFRPIMGEAIAFLRLLVLRSEMGR